MKGITSKTRIIAGSIMVGFSSIALLFGTYAWFHEISFRDNNASDLTPAQVSGKFKSITFHKLTKDEDGYITGIHKNNVGDTVSYSFEKEPVGTISYDWGNGAADGDCEVSLDEYIPLSPEQPMLLIFNLIEEETFEADNVISIKGACPDTYGFLGHREEDGTPTYALKDGLGKTCPKKDIKDGIYYFCLSSVVDFKCFSFEEGTISGDEETLPIENVTTHELDVDLSILDDADGFVNIDESQSSEITKPVFTRNATFYQNKSGDTVKHIGLIIDYYPTAIEYIFSTFLGDSILENEYENVLHYLCDWSFEI